MTSTERARKWRLANPEKVRAAQRRSYRRNPEKAKERSKAWRKANRGRINAKDRARRAADPEKLKADRRLWYADRRAKALHLVAMWLAANVEKLKVLHEQDKVDRVEKTKATTQRYREKHPTRGRLPASISQAELCLCLSCSRTFYPERAEEQFFKFCTPNKGVCADCRDEKEPEDMQPVRWKGCDTFLHLPMGLRLRLMDHEEQSDYELPAELQPKRILHWPAPPSVEVEATERKRLRDEAEAESKLRKEQARLKQAQKDAKWAACRKANPPSQDRPRPAPVKPAPEPVPVKPEAPRWYAYPVSRKDGLFDDPAARERQRQQLYMKLAADLQQANRQLPAFLQAKGRVAKLKFHSANQAWTRPVSPKLLAAYVVWREGGQRMELAGWDGARWLVTPSVEPLVKMWSDVPMAWIHPLGMQWHG